MAHETLTAIRDQVAQRIAQLHEASGRLSPADIYARLEAIRQLAAAHGLDALEGLARHSAREALLPGHRISTRTCIDRIGDALLSESANDRTTILASLAVRLH
jgi:hypothetical protein